MANWIWVVVAIAGGALLAALVGAIVKRKKKAVNK
jgi:LPXTG-motif cell wall-anchored protein